MFKEMGFFNKQDPPDNNTVIQCTELYLEVIWGFVTYRLYMKYANQDAEIRPHYLKDCYFIQKLMEDCLLSW